MNKKELKKRLREAGDATINYRSPNSRKQKYNVCTIDFNNKYIQSKDLKVSEGEDSVLMFCWDSDSFRLMKPENVVSIVPLSTVLKNTKGAGDG